MGIKIIDNFTGDLSAYERRLSKDNSDVAINWDTDSGKARAKFDNTILSSAMICVRLSEYVTPSLKIIVDTKTTPRGIVFNAIDASNCYAWAYDDGKLRLYKIVSAVPTLLKEELWPSYPAEGTWNLELDLSSPPDWKIRVWKEGETRPSLPTSTLSDSTFLALGKIGLFAGWTDWENLNFISDFDSWDIWTGTSSDFVEDFENPEWTGLWGTTVNDFVEDFESPEWAGAWTGTSSDFVEDFQSWSVGPL